MKKNRKPLAVLLAAAVTLSLAGCGGDNGSGGNTGGNKTTTTTKAPEQSFTEATAAPVDDTAETGTITWLMYEDLLTNNAEMVALFESRYGGTIEQRVTGSGDEYFETLGTLIATGDSPDIVRYEWRSFPHAMSYNMYTPLDTL